MLVAQGNIPVFPNQVAKMQYGSGLPRHDSQQMPRRGNNLALRRRDVKERTMNRFVALDSDIASRYDNDDDEGLPINQRSKVDRQMEAMSRDIRSRVSRVNRNQLMRSTGGRRDLIYKVTVRNGGRGDAEFVLQLLSDLSQKLLPFNVSEDSNKNVTFYVLTEDDAENIKMLNRRLFHPSDPRNKFLIYHNMQAAPWEGIDMKIKNTIREVVRERFNPRTNSLDLSSFQEDRLFAERDLRQLCSLTRNAILIETMRHVSELYPFLVSLSLKDNRLVQLSHVQSLTYACPSVVDLDLSNNNLENVEELKRIRQWRIARIFLENNPMCSAFSNASRYTSAVQDYLPYVTYLDGIMVESNLLKIKVDQQRRSGILYPPPQASYFPDKTLRQRVEQLMLQFYELYDGRPTDKSRQLLVNAYDEDATFTYAIYTLQDRESRQIRRGDENAYTQYIRSSHNLCQEEKWERYRDKIIYKGSMAIAVALSQLPVTEHDKNSFLLEFICVHEQLLVFTLRGILRDGADVEKSSGAYKFFTRTFTVVPKSDGRLAIANDDLILTAINQDRLEKYNEQLRKMVEVPDDPQPGPSGLVNNSAPTVLMTGLNVNNVPGPSGLQEELQRREIEIQRRQIENMHQMQMQQVAVEQMPVDQTSMQTEGTVRETLPYDRSDPEIQKAMINAFSEQSGMKLEWSRKCLEDSQWNFEAAGRVFNDLRSQIPPDAFM